jgi:hypothetical protein
MEIEEGIVLPIYINIFELLLKCISNENRSDLVLFLMEVKFILIELN